MWNYQEIIVDLQPSLLVEYGRLYGGSTLYFASLLPLIHHPAKIFSVDIQDETLDSRVRDVAAVELLTTSSTAPEVTERIRQLRQEYPGPMFAIVDSDHAKDHVLQEMLDLRQVQTAGDYLVVEDGDVNGHPIFPDFGPGPYEAIAEFFGRFPNDYRHDYDREHKFGLTFAVEGYLIRQ
jgi:cephalosporin hydroxylase